jgi:hypothetical protein
LLYQPSIYMPSTRRDNAFFIIWVSQHQQTRCLGDPWNGISLECEFIQAFGNVKVTAPDNGLNTTSIYCTVHNITMIWLNWKSQAKIDFRDMT